MKKIAIAGDHAGFEYKEKLVKKLKEDGNHVQDMGPFSKDSVDYADFAHLVSEAVAAKEADFGILICGSGNGVAMAANKHAGIRAALCWTEELASLAKQHNNANVLCLASRFTSYEMAEKCMDAFLNAEFEGGRHSRRVDKINC